MSEFDNWKEEQRRIHNDYDAENAWYAGQQSQQDKIDEVNERHSEDKRILHNVIEMNQSKIDELQKLRSLDEMAINQLAQANQVWRTKCDELHARIDSLTNINESLVAYKNQLLDEIEEKGQLKTLCKQLLVENVALRKIVNK